MYILNHTGPNTVTDERVNFLPVGRVNFFFRYKNERYFSTKMKLYQSVQRSFAMLGIHRNHLRQNHLLNGKILAVSFVYWTGIILLCLSYNTPSFMEYTAVMFESSVLIFNMTCHTVLIFKMEKLFQLIDKCENIIDERK